MASIEPDSVTEEELAVQSPSSRPREIVGIALVAVSVLAFISLFSDRVGTMGVYLAYGLRWFAGQAAYAPPLLVFILGLLAFRGRWQAPFMRRAAGVLLVFCSLLVVVHVLHFWPTLPDAWSIPEQVRIGMQGWGGGVAGSLFTAGLMLAFGFVGSVVLLAAALLIAIVLIFDVSLSRLVSGVVRAVWHLVSRLGHGLVQALFVIGDEAWHSARRMWERRHLRRLERTELAEEPLGEAGDTDSFTRPDRSGALGGGAGQDGGTMTSHAVTSPPLAGSDGDEPAGETASEPEQERAATGFLRSLMKRNGSRAENSTDGEFTTQSAQDGDDDDGTRLSDGDPLGASTAARIGEEREAADRGLQQKADTGEEAAGPGLTLRDLQGGGRLRIPPPSLLELPRATRRRGRRMAQEPDLSTRLEETLASFGVEARVVHVSRGPVITRYEVQPRPGIKVSRIVSLADDIALSLAATGVRMEAPVPGKPVIGIEVPNKQVTPVYLREVLESEAFTQSTSRLTVALGKDIGGHPVVADLTKLLHLLIAGATGSGKSVCLNSIIISLLYKSRPSEVKFIMIDPKRVELAIYDGIPHLIAPVVTDPRKAAGVLRWVVKEMERRYQLCSEAGTRNVDGYNAAIRRKGDPDAEVLPYLVVVIDELADLMLVAAADVEDAIARLAQMARAAGIYLLIATQRPSVDVITGLIKANVPSRISFAVSSQVDSRTILDMAGAERLLGKGDMLFHPIGSAKPQRVQGAFIEEREVEAVVSYWKRQQEPKYQEAVLQEQEAAVSEESEADDELFEDAVRLVREQGQASVSMIQRRFRVGYSRAARLIDMMEVRGIVGPYQGSKPREVLSAYASGEE